MPVLECSDDDDDDNGFISVKDGVGLNDFVLVEFTTKKSKKYFIGQIEQKMKVTSLV